MSLYNKALVVFATVVLGACGSSPEPEPDFWETDEYTERHMWEREQVLKKAPDYERRRAIERFHIKTQLLLARPKDEVSLPECDPMGLLQRNISLVVIAVLVGEQPARTPAVRTLS